MRMSDQTAIKALALQSLASALWVDGQEAEAMRVEAKARTLLGLAANDQDKVFPIKREDSQKVKP